MLSSKTNSEIVRFVGLIERQDFRSCLSKAFLLVFTMITYLQVAAFVPEKKPDSSKFKFAIGLGYKFGWFSPDKFWFNSESYPNFFWIELSRKRSTIGLNYSEGYYYRVKSLDDYTRMKRGDLIARATSEYGCYYSYKILDSGNGLSCFVSSGLNMTSIIDRRFISYFPGHFEIDQGYLFYKAYYLQLGGRVSYTWRRHLALSIDGAFLGPVAYSKIRMSPGTDEDNPIMKNYIRLITGVSYTF